MPDETYTLETQIGFLLRRANQRHLSIFGSHIGDLTPTQFAAIAKLVELGATSQNQLGRETAMDAATIKGVIDRLCARGLVATQADDQDRRRLLVELTPDGQNLWDELARKGRDVTAQTLAPLSAAEQKRFLALLHKLT